MEQVKEISKDGSTEQMHKLIVFNDNKNSFNHVVYCFIRILNQNPIQAEQCAQIIHNTGKYAVKLGEFEDLEEYCILLVEHGLDATIAI